jgi:hypothetical protein
MKTLELQNTKTKDLWSFQKKIKYLITPPCEILHKKIKNPENDKKKIEDSQILKYKTKNFQNS